VRQPSLYLREQWRTNTVGLGALAVAGLVVLALILWYREPVATAGGDAKERTEYSLSHESIPLSGTRETLFALERRAGDASTIVNLLVVNSDDATSRWIFPDNGQIILSRNELHMNTGSYSPVSGLVLTVSAGARESLYSYRVGGGPAVRFLTADSVVSVQQVAPDRYLVVSRTGEKTTATVYSLIDFSTVAQKEAPEVPQ
jgi:hypothetical protein